MRIYSLSFSVTLVLLLLGFCYCHDKTVEVVGARECSDCALNNIKSKDALSGLRVAIDCKVENGNFKTRGLGQLDGKGSFKVILPNELVKDNGELKEEYYAQLHSASKSPCTSDLKASKIVFKSRKDGKLTFVSTGKLMISPATCASAFFWPKYKFPPFPRHPWFKKPFPVVNFPPFPSHPPLVFPPIYMKPFPPPVPTYKPPRG